MIILNYIDIAVDEIGWWDLDSHTWKAQELLPSNNASCTRKFEESHVIVLF